MIKRIKKLKNKELYEIRMLKSNKEKIRNSKIVLYSLDQLKLAINYGVEIEYLVTFKPSIVDFAQKNNIDIYFTNKGIFNKLHNSKIDINLLAVSDIKKSDNNTNDNLVILDNILDQGNIGTIIRTGIAYGFQKFISTDQEFYPYTNKILNSSRGTNLIADFSKFEDCSSLYNYLKKNNYLILTTSPHGKTLSDYKLKRLNKTNKTALFLGNEKKGVNSYFLKRSDYNFKIDLKNDVESLNVGVFSGILFDKINCI
ncbi:TPA: TrmH family RNA methyltransferase [Staphylococcus aureus]